MLRVKIKTAYVYACSLKLYHMSRMMRNPAFYVCEHKIAVTAQLISSFDFAT